MHQHSDTTTSPAKSPSSSEVQGENQQRQNTLFRAFWVYIQGLIVIVLIVFMAQTIANVAAKISSWLGSVLGGGETTGWPVVIVLVLVIAVPWIVGRFTGTFLKLFQKDRGVQALMRWERHLTRELAPDQSRGYRVALLNWPNADVRTLGVVGATFLDPETGRKLAPVYLPNTPDISRGRIHVVPLEDLALTDWKLRDLVNCHLSLGSAIPPTPPDEATSGS